jgi:hypothetical protein
MKKWFDSVVDYLFFKNAWLFYQNNDHNDDRIFRKMEYPIAFAQYLVSASK